MIKQPFPESLMDVINESAGGYAGPSRTAYSNVPDSLMGFRKSGQNKGYDETNYPFSLDVLVDLGQHGKITDSIMGMNAQHALERAQRNWPDAVITPLGMTNSVANAILK